MVTVQFESTTCRLRIAGACPPDDRSELSAVLHECAAQAHGHLIVDLTAVTSMAPEVAGELVAAACEERARLDGPCVFLRRHGSPVDDLLTEAEDRHRTKSDTS